MLRTLLKVIGLSTCLFIVSQPSSAGSVTLGALAVPQVSSNMVLQYLFAYRNLFFTYLFTGNRAGVQNLLENALGCYATSTLLTAMPHENLYALEADVCTARKLNPQRAMNYFTDSTCTDSIYFQPTSYVNMCIEYAAPNKDKLGNAAIWEGRKIGWTLLPSNRFDIGIYPLQGNYQPFMTRVQYKQASVVRGNGSCQLEMRIFKKNLAANNLRPLLALHGGSWRYRGSAYLGLEAEISHLTERGFVVFLPFYRLTGDSSGNIECNGAHGSEIVKDAEDALAWVTANATQYGAQVSPTNKVTLMGHSSGAHLSGWLSVHRSAEIRKALLMYPPTDLVDYINELLLGNITRKASISAAELFFGQPLDQIDLNSSFALQNSYPTIIEQDPAIYPPMFIVHGNSDTVVPARHSVRLCNALSGSIDAGPAMDDGGDTSVGEYRKVYSCMHKDSQLHLIAEGDHALDACSEVLGCPAGSVGSQQAVRQTMLEAFQWLVQ